jgi:hypothetical protein
MYDMADEIEDYDLLPYGGLFGNSHLVRVIRQIVADPFEEYRPSDLKELAEVSAPSIRNDLKLLTRLGILIKDSSDKQHPIYRTNTECKRYFALTLLAYAVIDDRNGTDCTDDFIADYYDSELRHRYELSDDLEDYVTNIDPISTLSDQIDSAPWRTTEGSESKMMTEPLAASA